MATVRDDLDGIILVMSGGKTMELKAGDTIPQGVVVHDSLMGGKPDAEKPARRGRGRPKATEK